MISFSSLFFSFILSKFNTKLFASIESLFKKAIKFSGKYNFSVKIIISRLFHQSSFNYHNVAVSFLFCGIYINKICS